MSAANEPRSAPATVHEMEAVAVPAVAGAALGHLAKEFAGSGLSFDAEHGGFAGCLVRRLYDVHRGAAHAGQLGCALCRAGGCGRQVNHRQDVRQRLRGRQLLLSSREHRQELGGRLRCRHQLGGHRVLAHGRGLTTA